MVTPYKPTDRRQFSPWDDDHTLTCEDRDDVIRTPLPKVNHQSVMFLVKHKPLLCCGTLTGFCNPASLQRTHRRKELT